jgi:hypothetical protein
MHERDEVIWDMEEEVITQEMVRLEACLLISVQDSFMGEGDVDFGVQIQQDVLDFHGYHGGGGLIQK